jgi:hypothetical protein
MKHHGPRDEEHLESLSAIPVSLTPPTGRPPPRRPGVRPVDRRRRIGSVFGFCLAVGALGYLFLPDQKHFSAPGVMNTGHETIGCDSCHRSAPGTVRQQLQADVRYLAGLRKSPADFGMREVLNKDCLACHERPFDRHPVFRFNEPRFVEVRQVLAPQQCESCHREHSGARVTVESGYCRNCHGALEMKNDPLDTPHAQLVREGRWSTCLGCHDFHGNHVMQTSTRLAEALPPAQINNYFRGDVSPYPPQLRKPAQRNRADRGD